MSEDVNASMYCFIFLSLPVDKPICAFIYTYMYTYIYTHTSCKDYVVYPPLIGKESKQARFVILKILAQVPVCLLIPTI